MTACRPLPIDADMVTKVLPSARFGHRKSFRNSVLRVSLATMALAFVVIVAIAAAYNNEKGVRELKRQVDLATNIDVQSLSAIIGRNDVPAAATRLANLALDPDFRSGMVVDHDGAVMISFPQQPKDISPAQSCRPFRRPRSRASVGSCLGQQAHRLSDAPWQGGQPSAAWLLHRDLLARPGQSTRVLRIPWFGPRCAHPSRHHRIVLHVRSAGSPRRSNSLRKPC